MTTPLFDGWQALIPEAGFSNPSDCKSRAEKFERQIKWRNRIEFGTGLLLVILFGAFGIGAFVVGEWMIGASITVLMFGVMVVMWQLVRRASTLVQRPEEPCLEHLARQYRRQYEALRWAPVWYVGPLLPGFVLFYTSVTIRTAEYAGSAAAIESVVPHVLIAAAIFGAVAIANLFTARAIKAKLDAIEALA